LPVADDRTAHAGDRNPGYDLGLELLFWVWLRAISLRGR
jgi:hypothetical protein